MENHTTKFFLKLEKSGKHITKDVYAEKYLSVMKTALKEQMEAYNGLSGSYDLGIPHKE